MLRRHHCDLTQNDLVVHAGRMVGERGRGNFNDFIEWRMQALYTSGLYLRSSEAKYFQVEICEGWMVK